MYLKAALFAKYAYKDGTKNVVKNKTFENFGEYECQYYKKNNTEFYTISNEYDIYFCFRGTSDIKDAFDVMQTWAERDTEIGKVHSGFYENAMDVMPIVKTILKNNKKRVFFVGHSLGGAIAKIIGMKNPDIKNLTVITFGEPKSCRDKFHVYNQTYIRIVNHCDVAPRIRCPFTFGVRNEIVVYINRKGELIMNPGLTYMWVDVLMTNFKSFWDFSKNPIADHYIDSYIKELRN